MKAGSPSIYPKGMGVTVLFILKKKNRGANPPQKGRGYCERVTNDLLLIIVFVNPKNITI